MSKKVWVSGSLAYDRIMDYDGRFSDHLNPKKIHVINLSFAVKNLSLSYGGTAGNIAYNLALLNVPAGVICNLGHDGKDYFQKLREQKTDLRLVQMLADQFTAGAYIITDRADNQITGFYAGAMDKKSLSPKSTAKDLAIVAADEPTNMTRLCLHYQKTGTPYIYDPGQQITALSASYLLQAMRSAWVIIGNDYEIDLIFRKTAYRPSPKQIVVTTFGQKGSSIKTGSKAYKIPVAKPKKTVDPTGAGDAYRAGLIAGIIKRYDWGKAGRLASVVAVHAVESLGTQNHVFNWESLQKRYFRDFHERL